MCDLRPPAKLRRPNQAGGSEGSEVTSQELCAGKTFPWARFMLYCTEPEEVNYYFCHYWGAQGIIAFRWKVYVAATRSIIHHKTEKSESLHQSKDVSRSVSSLTPVLMFL